MCSRRGSPRYSWREIRRLLQERDIHPSKGLGQHFLTDQGALERIVEAADLNENEAVLEIGPGPGVLTQLLVERASRVVCVELDDEMISILNQVLNGHGNAEILQGDILETDLSELMAPFSAYRVVANLPYYITSAVLRHLLEADFKPTTIVVTVQHEVAQRITAEPGEMSTLSVSVQFYGEPKIVTRILAGAFYPSPDVDSAVLRIDVFPKPRVHVEDLAWFFQVVRAGFAQRRKQLRNSLSSELGIDPDEIVAALERARIDARRRAQTLTVEEWGAAAQELLVLSRR